jgi:hypothetical protein
LLYRLLQILQRSLLATPLLPHWLLQHLLLLPLLGVSMSAALLLL